MAKKRVPTTPEQIALLASLTNPDLDEVEGHVAFGKQFTWGNEPAPTGLNGDPTVYESSANNEPLPATTRPGTANAETSRDKPERRSTKNGQHRHEGKSTEKRLATTSLPPEADEADHDQSSKTTLLRVFTKTTSVIEFNQLVNQVAMRANVCSTRIRGDILASLITYAVDRPDVIQHLATHLTEIRKHA